MRIQTNRFKDLAVEQSVALPAWLQNKSMAEATRLGVGLGQTGRMVKTVLFKALYLYCVEAGIEWMVITARPPLDRQYEALMFDHLFPGQFIPMRHVNDIPHCVLAFEVGTAEDRWAEANHPLFKFMFQTRHPDIDLSGSEASPRVQLKCPRGWRSPRNRRGGMPRCANRGAMFSMPSLSPFKVKQEIFCHPGKLNSYKRVRLPDSASGRCGMRLIPADGRR
jgi:hypothetical protein